MSLSNKQSYSLDNNHGQYFVFETKIKTLDDKIVIRKMKTQKEGCLFELPHELDNIVSIKISIFSFEEPNKPVCIKRKFEDLFITNFLITEQNVIINLVNNDKFVCYYKLF